MSTASPQPFSDTMLWRNILHNLRAPSGVITVIGVPLIFLLLFVSVLGETLGAGLMTGGTRDEYLAYITPAILLMAAASATQMIAVWISMDMSEGIIARFRTMAIARSSVLAGHVYGGTILITVSIAALLGFALVLGYRPQADALDWLALAGLVVLVGFATRLAVGRVRARRRETGHRQQLAPAADDPAPAQRRIRAHRVAPRLAARNRRIPAVHAHHQHHPRPPRRRPRGTRCGVGRRLVHRDRRHRLRLLAVALPSPRRAVDDPHGRCRMTSDDRRDQPHPRPATGGRLGELPLG
jgi:hypothetical protein